MLAFSSLGTLFISIMSIGHSCLPTLVDKSAEVSGQTCFSPNSSNISVSLLEDDVSSGSVLTATLTTSNNENSIVFVNDCDQDVSVSLINNDDGTFTTNFNTKGDAGEFCVMLSAKEASSIEPDSYDSINLYVYSDGIRDCASYLSMDDARSKYFINHVATEEELVLLGIEDAPDDFSPSISRPTAETHYSNFVYGFNDIIEETTFSFGDYSDEIKIEGHAIWCDEKGGEHPLQRTIVELYDDYHSFKRIYDSTHTDEFGNFSFEVDDQSYLSLGGRNLYMIFYAANDAVIVGNHTTYTYKYCTSEYFLVERNTKITCNIKIFPGLSDRSSAFEICQAEIIPHDYAFEMSGKILNAIDVFYPSVAPDECYYFGYLIGNFADYIGVGKDYYKDWDCLNHEYGHYICKQFGFCDMPLPMTHKFGHNLIDDVGRKDGLSVAMSEGLASYLGTAAQMYYADKYVGYSNVGDEIYSSVNRAYANYSSYRAGQTFGNCGEGSETTVTSALIKLMDDVERDGDNVGFGHEKIWEALSSAHHSNISELICTILMKNPECQSEIGKILELEGLSPTPISEGNSVLSVDPNNSCWTFSWKKNGFTNGQPNRFTLKFEGDSDDSYEIENITSASITLNSSQINEVLSLSGTAIKWHVVSYNDDTPITGGYVTSEYMSLKPSSTNLSLNAQTSMTLYSGKTSWFKFTAPYNGTYYFESFSSLDLYGELFSFFVADGTYPNRIAYNDDGGTDRNFKVSKTMSTNETVYLRVSGYNRSASIYGSFTISTTVVHTHAYYDHFLKYSPSKHKAYCSCGEYELKQHVTSSGNTITRNGRLYSNCVECGALVDLGSTPSVIE